MDFGYASPNPDVIRTYSSGIPFRYVVSFFQEGLAQDALSQLDLLLIELLGVEGEHRDELQVFVGSIVVVEDEFRLVGRMVLTSPR